MHNHHCPFCQQDFDCEVPFCEGVNPMMCDDCFQTPAKLDGLSDGLRRVADYMREREPAEQI